jgi:ribosome-associated protein
MAMERDPQAGWLSVSRSLRIPMSEISWRASRSSGPGGQHANKTSSRVSVQFDVAQSNVLGPRQRARLLDRIGPVVRAEASEQRSQARNREMALDRLAGKISAALRTESPRYATKPTMGAKERRLATKHRHAEIKKLRGRADPED